MKTNIKIVNKPECLYIARYRGDISILRRTQAFYFLRSQNGM